MVANGFASLASSYAWGPWDQEFGLFVFLWTLSHILKWGCVAIAVLAVTGLKLSSLFTKAEVTQNVEGKLEKDLQADETEETK